MHKRKVAQTFLRSKMDFLCIRLHKHSCVNVSDNEFISYSKVYNFPFYTKINELFLIISKIFETILYGHMLNIIINI